MLRRSAFLAAILSLVSACAVIRVGPSVEVIELDDTETAEKNLDAVRAIVREWSSRPPTGPPAEDTAAPLSLTAAEKAPLLHVNPVVPPSVPPASPKTQRSTVLPWTPPQISASGLPDRPVPAYTIPAPGGPDHTGSTRCVPDGLGGQRCLRQ